MKLLNGKDTYDELVADVSQLNNTIGYDASNYATIAEAVTAIGATKATLNVPYKSTVYPITANLTIPSNIVLKVANGAVLQPANGVAPTLNCKVDAGEYQIFDLSLGGKILGSYKNFGVCADWFGLIGDDATDNTALAYNMFSCLGGDDVGYVNYVDGGDLPADAALRWKDADAFCSISSISNGVATLTPSASTSVSHNIQQYYLKPKASHTYFFRVKVNSVTTGKIKATVYNKKSDGALESATSNTISAGATGNLYVKITTTSVHAYPRMHLRIGLFNSAGTESYIKTTESATISEIMLLDLTDMGLASLSAAECSARFPFFAEESNMSGEVLFPSGTYLVNDELIFPEGITVKINEGAIIKAINTSGIEEKELLQSSIGEYGKFIFNLTLGTKWSAQGSSTSRSVLNSVQTFTPTAQYGGIVIPVPYTEGDKIYACGYVRTSDVNAIFSIGATDLTPTNGTNHPGTSDFRFLSGLLTTEAQEDNVVFIYSAATSAWAAIYVKEVTVYNLTVIFGAGNEPDKATMDAYMALKAKTLKMKSKIIAGDYQIFNFGFGRTVTLSEKSVKQSWFGLDIAEIAQAAGANQQSLYETNNINMLERTYSNQWGGGAK